MATAVVAGRVDEAVKNKVDALLRIAGTSASELIGRLWEHVAETEEIPAFASQGQTEVQTDNLDDFLSFVDSLPPAPAWLKDMDRDAMRDMIANRYV